MRLFIAIPIPEDIRQKLIELQRPFEGVRWVPEEQMHLTLKFVGDFDNHQTESLMQNLKGIRFESFHLGLNGLGFFPERGTPRVFWAGVSYGDPLIELQKKVEKSAVAAGAEKEKYNYKPHVTLARINSSRIKREELLQGSLSEFQTRTFTVDRFILYESLLRPEGAVHRQLAVYRDL